MNISLCLPQDIPWPPWVDMFTIISHLALTISCSISFYIYYGKYGAPKQVMNRRLTKFRSLMRSPNRINHIGEDVEMMAMPDIDNLVENTEITITETSFRGSHSSSRRASDQSCKGCSPVPQAASLLNKM